MNRRDLLITATAAAGAAAGCQTNRYHPQETSERQLPRDLGILHIRSESERIIPVETAETPRLIQWETNGTLTIESGGALTMEASDRA